MSYFRKRNVNFKLWNYFSTFYSITALSFTKMTGKLLILMFLFLIARCPSQSWAFFSVIPKTRMNSFSVNGSDFFEYIHVIKF